MMKPKDETQDQKVETPEPLDLEEQDQNVTPDGYCTMSQDAEMARANSGGECDEAM